MISSLPPVGSYPFLAEPFHCDYSGHLFIGHLANHMLNAADYHSNDRGFGMRYLSTINRAWVLSRLAIEIVDMPVQYTKFNVDTWVENAMRYFTNRNFAAVGDDGHVYAYGRSIWAMIDSESRKTADIFAVNDGSISNFIYTDRENPIKPASRVTMHITPATVDSLADEYVGSERMGYSDIDINGHVNSVKYVEHFLNLWNLDWYRQHQLRRLEIAYVSESYEGDTLHYYREQTGENEWSVMAMRDTPEGKVEVCRCKLRFK